MKPREFWECIDSARSEVGHHAHDVANRLIEDLARTTPTNCRWFQHWIDEHNRVIADAIRAAQQNDDVGIVVLAQMSMSVFSFAYPDPVAEFGVEVLNSGQTGFRRAGEVLANT